MNLLLFGAMGHMGQEVLHYAKEREDILIAPVDKNEGCYTLEETRDMPVDVILDFSHHTAIHGLLAYAKERLLPLVVATTGHTEAERNEIVKASAVIPIMLCENLSKGIMLFFQMAVETARYFSTGEGEIIEIHRKGKADKPGGTAKKLAEYIKASTGRQTDIPIHAIRLGDTVGTHTLVFGNGEENITLTHSVHHRRLFTKGGITACEFIMKQQSGLYTLEDMVKKDETSVF